jgi:predicted small secreted protein
MARRIAGAFFAFVFLTMSLQACNTLRGAGQDVERAGEGIQKSTQ